MSEVLKLIEFVERIENRIHPVILKYPHLAKYDSLKCMVSREELFGELTSLAEQFVHNSKVNKIYCKNPHCPSCTHCKNNQFMFMWKELKKKYNYYQIHGYKVESPNSEIVPCSRCGVNIPYSISNFHSDECFLCLYDSKPPSDNRTSIGSNCKVCGINPKYQSQAICRECHNAKTMIRRDPTKLLIGNREFVPKKCLDCGGFSEKNIIGKYKARCKVCAKIHLDKKKEKG